MDFVGNSTVPSMSMSSETDVRFVKEMKLDINGFLIHYQEHVSMNAQMISIKITITKSIEIYAQTMNFTILMILLDVFLVLSSILTLLTVPLVGRKVVISDL